MLLMFSSLSGFSFIFYSPYIIMYIRIIARAMKRDFSQCHKVFVFENYFKRIGYVKERRKTHNQK